MKNLRKAVALLIILALSVIMLAGCGSSNTTTTTAGETKAATTSGTTKAEETKAVQKEKIRFVVWDMTTNAKEFQNLIDTFNQESKTVEVEPVDIASKDYNEKVAIMLAAGENVDGLAVKDLTQYSGCVLKNQLATLDDFIARTGFDTKPYGSNIDVLKDNGKIVALPYRSDIWILFYNKDIFDNAKVPYPTDDMTWDQFRETAKKLTSGEGNNKIYGTYFHTWENVVADISTATRKGTLVDGNFDYLKPAYELALAMQQVDKSAMSFAAAKTSSAHYKAMFETGKVGMHVMGTWHIGQLIADKNAGQTNINWGIAKAPHFPENPAGTTVGNLTPVAITAYSKKMDSAFEFLQFIAGEKGASILGKMGLMPGYRSQAVLDAVTSVNGFPVDNKSALDTVDVVQQLLPHKNAAQMKKILGEENELILTKAKTIDEAIKSLNERTKELAADNK
jgi:multiple sugar transport system substrate-binding protein